MIGNDKTITFRDMYPDYDGPEPDGLYRVLLKDPTEEITAELKYIKHLKWQPVEAVPLVTPPAYQFLHIHYWQDDYIRIIPVWRIVEIEIIPNSVDVVAAIEQWQNNKQAIWEEMERDGNNGGFDL